jgi:uncharacterized membrane protein
LGGVGCGFSIAAAIFAIFGLLPLFGWLNWFTTLPFAFLAILFGLLGLIADQQRSAAALALIFGVILLCWGLFRLLIGGGIV